MKDIFVRQKSYCQKNSHGAGIKHTARVPAVGCVWVRSNPFVFKVDHRLNPKAGVGAFRAWFDWAVLGIKVNDRVSKLMSWISLTHSIILLFYCLT